MCQGGGRGQFPYDSYVVPIFLRFIDGSRCGGTTDLQRRKNYAIKWGMRFSDGEIITSDDFVQIVEIFLR